VAFQSGEQLAVRVRKRSVQSNCMPSSSSGRDQSVRCSTETKRVMCPAGLPECLLVPNISAVAGQIGATCHCEMRPIVRRRAEVPA
jgi:hypothetical protein